MILSIYIHIKIIHINIIYYQNNNYISIKINQYQYLRLFNIHVIINYHIYFLFY